MGMYTEILFRAELRADVPEVVLDALRHLVGDGPMPAELPDHALFATDRWDLLGTGSSYYFPASFTSQMAKRDQTGWEVSLNANLKDYDGEIEKFFDWIDPYVYAMPGEFIGYSLYEESDTPVIHHKRDTTKEA